MISDEQAEVLIGQVLNLAVVIRDEGPDAVIAALRPIRDPWAALAVAAALVHVDEPVDAWWAVPAAGKTMAPLAVALPASGRCPGCGDPGPGHCRDCGEPIAGRPSSAWYCEPCRVAHRRETARRSTSRRRQVAA